jgi:transcriptional regulator with XRE-family HTH domain
MTEALYNLGLAINARREGIMTLDGSSIKAAREAKGMTQAELAEEVGVAQQTIDKIESGKMKRTTYLPEIQSALSMVRCKSLGERIAFARRWAKKTQADVAAALNITPQAVSGWERNEARPELDKMAELAALVGAQLDWLIGHAGREPPSGTPPLQVLRTILCADPTAEQILAALEANGLSIVPKSNGLLVDLEEGSAVPVSTTEAIDDPIAFVREVMERRGVSSTQLARSAGISPSTLNRALNDPNHTCIWSSRTLRKIKEWDNGKVHSL